MTTKIYKKEFKEQLETIFAARASFLPAFGGELKVEDTNYSDEFINIKIGDTDTVIAEYNLEAKLGEGSRFGEINEIISIDKVIPLDKPMKFNDGIDKVTVNDDFEEIAAERFALNAKAWAIYYDKILGDYLADNAGEEIKAEATIEGVIELFDKANEALINNGVSVDATKTAYVTPKVYALIVNSPLSVAYKGSSVNIDENSLLRFKEFNVVQVPAPKMKADAYFAVNNVGIAGLGLSTARVIEHADYDGVVIQGTSKLGKYIPEQNKKAIILGKFEDVVEG